MKLNKPTVTDTQTELENYVASLLLDTSKVTHLPRKPLENGEVSESNSQSNQNVIKKAGSRPKITSLPEHKKLISKTSEAETKTSIRSEAHSDRKQELFSSEEIVVEMLDSLNIAEKDRAVPEKSREKEPVVKVEKRTSENQELTNSSALASSQKRKKPANTKSRRAGGNADIDKNAPNKVMPVESVKTNQRRANFGTQKEVKHNQTINKEKLDYKKASFKTKEEKDPRLEGVEKLLAKIAMAKVVAPSEAKPASAKKKVETKEPSTAEETRQEQQIALENAKSSFSHRENEPLKNSLGSVFQTLVFEVEKLPLAVPLVKLGGIVNVSQQDITPLVGTPDWFMGLVPNERGNLMVVDTQKFLMPEQKGAADKEYRYLIILDDSQWALACHSVGDAKNLSPDDIRWSSRSSKRPWFAGMVVEYMSALVEVDELINMLAENIVE